MTTPRRAPALRCLCVTTLQSPGAGPVLQAADHAVAAWLQELLTLDPGPGSVLAISAAQCREVRSAGLWAPEPGPCLICLHHSDTREKYSQITGTQGFNWHIFDGLPVKTAILEKDLGNKTWAELLQIFGNCCRAIRPTRNSARVKY